MDKTDYDYRHCSRRSRTQHIGMMEFTIHEIEPGHSPYADFSAFLSFCSSLIREDAIVIISSDPTDHCNFRPYGFTHGSDFFLYELTQHDETATFYVGNLGAPPRHVKLVRCVQALADSITDCIAVPMVYPMLRRLTQVDTGFVVASKGVAGFLYRLLGLELSAIIHGTSLEVSSDYAVFDYLWMTPLSREELMEKSREEERDSVFHFLLGRCVGGLHSRCILPDAHLDNFILDGRNDRVVLVDRDDPIQKNYLRNLDPHECATNLVTLLATFNAYQWGWFKWGYLQRRGEEGKHVISVIEGTPLDPWASYLDAGRYYQALERLLPVQEDIVARTSHNVPAIYANSALCFSKIGEYEAAVNAYLLSLETLSDSDNETATVIYFNLAKTYYRMGNYEQAIESFEIIRTASTQKEQLSPTIYFETLYGLIHSYQALSYNERWSERLDELIAFMEETGRDNIKAAFDIEVELLDLQLTRAIEQNPRDISAIVSHAELVIGKEEWGRALNILNCGLVLEPLHVEMLTMRGQIHVKLKQFNFAERDLDLAIELEPNNIPCLTAHSEFYEEIQNYDGAVADLARLIALDRDSVEKRLKRGRLLWVLNRHLEAIAELNVGMELLSKSDRRFMLYLDARATIQYELGNYEAAIVDLTELIHLSSWNSSVQSRFLLLRSTMFQEAQKYDEALDDLNQLIEMEPEDPDYFLQRGDLYREMSDYANALESYNRAKEYGAPLPTALLFLGVSRLMLGDTEKALELLSEAVELSQGDDTGWAHYQRALASRLLAHKQDSVTDLNVAIEVARARYQTAFDDWRNTFNLGLYLIAAHKEQEARFVYQQALAHSVPDVRIREAIRDIDEFLHLFPNEKGALTLRDLLGPTGGNVR